VCLSVCVPTITFELDNFPPKYLTCWFIVILSKRISKVKVMDQRINVTGGQVLLKRSIQPRAMACLIRQWFWMNVYMQTECQLLHQTNWLGPWVCQQAAIIHINHRHLLLLLPSTKSDTHFTVPRMVEGWVDLGTAVRVCSPCPRLYTAVAVVINTTAGGEIRTWVLSHRSQACYR